MSIPTESIWTTQTERGWLAGSSEFPRITKRGSSEQEALHNLAERRAWWQSLPEPSDSDAHGQ